MNPILIKQKLQHHLQNNQITEALNVCNQLCKSTPSDVEAWLICASIHAQLGAFPKIVECCETVIKLQSNHVMAHYNLGLAHHSMGNLESAEKSFRNTLRLNPDLHVASIALAHAVMCLGRTKESVKIYNRLLSSSARDNKAIALKANNNLSLALCELKQFSEAEKMCQKALIIDPNSAEALNNLGQAMKAQGNLKGATDAYRKAINNQPDFVVAHSNLLLDLNYLPDVKAKDVLAEHRKWGLLHASPPIKRCTIKKRNPDKRLRVGYVSPDFRAHSVILFIAGLIKVHDRNNVEIYCYSNVKKPDAWTSQIKNTSDHWRTVVALNDDQFAAMITEDKIDILVDLAGHTAGNRLLAFASKPAPIQVTWLGYPNTTGMNAIDYRLTDVWADTPGVSDELHTETLIRLPQGFLCYQPLHDSPPINPLPMSQRGSITFGCFNNSAKINDDVIKLWSRLLAELPNSRLLLKSSQLSDPPLKQQYLSKFEQAGIDSTRIEIHGHIASTIDHLSLYHEIDVALDPFPYNGTTTTCEALWMGVPVVVLEGSSHAGRVGVSLLNNVGLPELIAKTNDDYIHICCELSANTERLTELRIGMRARLQNAPLLDSKKFAENIETAYRNMWIKYC